jgi:probable rRNA maturation factor
LSFRIYYDKTSFRLLGWKRAKKTIEEVIRNELRVSGDLNVIITNDESIREINLKFLSHDYYTDVIAFNYSEDEVINGEIYISIETVKRNAFEYKVNVREEVLRVIIHGVLHLIGFEDKTDEEKEEMRRMEDFWLEKLRNAN